MKQCFFMGHRDTPESIYPALCAAVEQHIVQYGVTEFLVGERGAFDRLATRAVIAAKRRHLQVRLTRLLAYLPPGQTPMPPGFDGSLYPEGLERIPPVYAIVRANQWAVDRADYLIGYVHRTPSNAEKIVKAAQKKGVPVTLL